MANTKKLIFMGILVSQALVLSIIEKALPSPVPIPGVKLGLANIISLFAIIIFGFKEAVIIVIIRNMLASIFVGGMASFLYSIIGGLISIIVMSFIYKNFEKQFSIVSISIMGAIFHNIGQIFVASIIIKDIKIFYYLPILMISGVITGMLIGIASKYSIEPIKKLFQ